MSFASFHSWTPLCYYCLIPATSVLGQAMAEATLLENVADTCPIMFDLGSAPIKRAVAQAYLSTYIERLADLFQKVWFIVKLTFSSFSP